MPRQRPDEGDEDLLPELQDDDDDLSVDEPDEDDGQDDEPDDGDEDYSDADRDEEVDEDDEYEPRRRRKKDRGDERQSRRGQRTQRRIQALLKERKELEERAVQAEQRFAQQQSQVSQWQTGGLDAEISNLEQIAKAERAEMARAHEAGDTASMMDAQDRYYQAMFQLNDRRSRKAQITAAAAQTQQQQGQQPAQQNQQQNYLDLPRPLVRWANKIGFGKLSDETKVGAMQIAEDMKQEGYSITEDDDFFDELDRRLAEEFPRQFGKDAPRRKRVYRAQGDPGNRRRPSEPAPRSDAASTTRGTAKRRLDSDDIKAMRLGGLDPNSDKDRSLYLRANPSPMRRQKAGARR